MADPKGYSLLLTDSESSEKLWMGHYKKDVDVAVLPVNFNLFELEKMQVSYFHDEQHTLLVKDMEDVGQTEGDGAFVLGFPVSLVGDKSSSVIVRSGTIARVKDTLVSPKEPFLVDTVVFPGNSGGPVVNKPELTHINDTQAINKASLIGIVASYVPYFDYAISSQTGRPRVIFEENSGLANVFSVDCIKSAVNSYERQRKKRVKLAELQASKEASEEQKSADNETFSGL